MTGSDLRTLLSHEWLAPHGGSENVFEQIALALPGSSLLSMWNDAPERFGAEVAETWLSKTPLRRSKAAALPFLSAAWRSVDLSGFDRVVASSHAFGHHLATRAAEQGLDGFAYVHTPARYVWNPELDERGHSSVARAGATLLKRLDRRRTSAKVSYAANSEYVRQRIADAWDRDATVLYPPVAVDRIQSRANWADSVTPEEMPLLDSLPDTFVLGASRLIEYKRLDLTMRVGEAMGLPVVLAGSGPYEPELRALGETMSVPVTFAGRVSDELLYALYQRAELMVFMAIEDFGIMPVEAVAAGTPVLVNEIGGAAESVRILGGGATVSESAGSTLLKSAASAALSINSSAAADNAQAFSESAFRASIRQWTRTGTEPVE